MERDVDCWLEELAVPFLKRVGVQSNQRILDFGCGPGFYTVLATRIVGRMGRVFALDKSVKVLQELEQRVCCGLSFLFLGVAIPSVEISY